MSDFQKRVKILIKAGYSIELAYKIAEQELVK